VLDLVHPPLDLERALDGILDADGEAQQHEAEPVAQLPW
jgi:hypothetical protein